MLLVLDRTKHHHHVGEDQEDGTEDHDYQVEADDTQVGQIVQETETNSDNICKPYKNILISQKIFGIINRYLPTHSTAPDKGPNHQILAKNSSVDNNFLSSIFVISRSQLLTISLTNGVDTISLTTGTC